MAGLRGLYETAEGARRVIAKASPDGSLAGLVGARLEAAGAQRLESAAYAGRGDIAVFDPLSAGVVWEGFPEAVGVVFGAKTALLTAQGLVAAPTLRAFAAWKP